MEHTVSLKLNHVFRRLYGRGKSAVNPCLAVYCRKNNLGYSRLGLTVGVKLGKAVVRNRTRRRIKEAYRIHEGAFLPGYDIVVVARVRAAHSRYRELERSLLSLADKIDGRAFEAEQGFRAVRAADLAARPLKDIAQIALLKFRDRGKIRDDEGPRLRSGCG